MLCETKQPPDIEAKELHYKRVMGCKTHMAVSEIDTTARVEAPPEELAAATL
jgi:hypothetical protein